MREYFSNDFIDIAFSKYGMLALDLACLFEPCERYNTCLNNIDGSLDLLFPLWYSMARAICHLSVRLYSPCSIQFLCGHFLRMRERRGYYREALEVANPLTPEHC